jgi:hypothetical protein
VRESVEWLFGGIVQLFPLADLKSIQKLDACEDVFMANKNRVMKKVRESVEWSFGGIIQLFPLADLKSTQKLDACEDVLCA